MSVSRRRCRRWLAGTASAVLLVGCAANPSTPTSSASATSSVTGFTNPVYDNNFPDPVVAQAGGTYRAFATNGNGSNVQSLTSTDLVHWEQGDDALPHLPGWSHRGKVWAPDVARARNGYVLYYTTAETAAHVQCISAGVSRRLAGPYVDTSRKPLVCQPGQGGSIDADEFTASDGRRYLYWKNDGNAIGAATYLSVQQLDAAGTKLVGRPTRLLTADLDWEGPLVEAPFLWEQDGKFHLFYSANRYDSDAYAVGHAVADSPLGPFVKSKAPVLASNDVAAGPGHCALIRKDGKVWMLYHAWPPDSVGQEIPGRTLWLSEVTFGSDGSVSVVPPKVSYPVRP